MASRSRSHVVALMRSRRPTTTHATPCSTKSASSSVRVLALLALAPAAADFVALDPSEYRELFVEGWPGPYLNGTGSGEVNQSSFEWAVSNLPLFNSSDADITEAFYFRAKTYKSHLVQTDWADITHVVSEFGPSVAWGGVYGTINAAAGHHLHEGRWLRDAAYMDGLARFWIGSQVQI